MKATIKCLGILSYATKPYPIIAARFRGTPTYIYLDLEERKHSRANLYRCEEDGARRTSFLRAVDAENRWISKFQAT